MSEQPPLFNMEQAVAAGEQGKALALSGDRNRDWQIAASAWLDRQPSGTEFQMDDITREIGKPDPYSDDPVNRRNVAGAWMSKQAQQGRIRHIGHVRSSSESRHGSIQGRWRKV